MTAQSFPGNEQPSDSFALFENEAVTEMEGRLPAVTIKMTDGYPRDTHLRLAIEVRIKSVRLEERGKEGLELVRQHVFAVESVEWAAAFDPADAVDSVGGSASVYALPSAERSAELGITFKRTSDQWGSDKPTGF